LGLLYPGLVYLALGRVPAGALAALALILVGARLGLTRGRAATGPLVPALAATLVATATFALLDPTLAVLTYPVLMSLGMAAAFGLSLRGGPTLVENFASLTEPEPSPSARAYMRKVTLVWFMFLLGNATLSALTVAAGDRDLWTLYNGLISYLLMGTLFAIEYLIRRRVRARETAA
jgi:uncharacterized membrane protein